MRLSRRMQDDLERDIREHIELETRDNVERGMSPEAARFAALRKFGNVALAAEDTRAVWRWMWLDRFRQDIRHALRGLRRNPAFAAVSILTLALAIGMNAAVFSVVSATLIKPLPYPEPNRLMWVAMYSSRFHFEASSAPDFSDWRSQTHSFDKMAGYGTVDRTVQDGSESSKHSFVWTTPEFWSIAGAHAALGRLFSAADRNVVVLTWRMFEQQFASDRRVVGKTVRVDGRSTTIIGVLPAEFRFLPPGATGGLLNGMSGEAEAFTPVILTPELQRRGGPMLLMFVVARLKPGISRQQALAELQNLEARTVSQYPAMRDFYTASQLRVVPLQEKLVGESRRALLILLAAVGFVLLIACANLGNLLLARATTRRREMAIRSAIGAGRGRLLRYFLVEAIALAMPGAAAGLVLARAAVALLVRLSPAAVPRIAEVAIDWRVTVFTIAASFLAALIFGCVPVFSLPAGSLYAVLKDGGRASGSRNALRLRQILVAAELALALVLLMGAGLMVKSFARMYNHPTSFEPEKIGIAKVFLSGPAYRDSERGATLAYAKHVIDQASAIAGVEKVALSNISGSGFADVDGSPRFPPGQAPQVVTRAVSFEYPRLVGIPLLKGRLTADNEAARVVMVNQTFARRVFGDENPLGQRLRISGGPAAIVGVVGDLKVSRLDAEPEPEILVPFQQASAFRRFDVLFKSSTQPAALLPEVRKAIQRIDPTQPPYGLSTLENALDESIAPRRFNLLLLGAFAGGAVLLALVGIYGLTSYSVTQRTQEIGVRMALGARRKEIVRMVVRHGMIVALAGIVPGITAALALTRLMAALLFNVQPNDAPTFAVVTAALTATALAACLLPALRAARVDPTAALRYE